MIAAEAFRAAATRRLVSAAAASKPVTSDPDLAAALRVYEVVLDIYHQYSCRLGHQQTGQVGPAVVDSHLCAAAIGQRPTS